MGKLFDKKVREIIERVRNRLPGVDCLAPRTWVEITKSQFEIETVLVITETPTTEAFSLVEEYFKEIGHNPGAQKARAGRNLYGNEPLRSLYPYTPIELAIPLQRILMQAAIQLAHERPELLFTQGR